MIVETPRGRRSKFTYDPEYDMFKLSGLLPEGLLFPLDFGFIPSTLGEDGDPLDILVLMEEPAHVGCLLDVRLIGVIEAEQVEGEKRFENDRLLGVSVRSYAHEHVHALEQVSTTQLDHWEAFFVSFNQIRGKQFLVKGRQGPKRALELVQKGIAKFKTEPE